MHTKAVILSLSFVALVATGTVAPAVAKASDLNVRVHVEGFTFGYRHGYFIPRHSYYHHYRPRYYTYGHGYRRGYHHRHPRHWRYKPGRYYIKRHPHYRSTPRQDRARHHVTRPAPRGFRDAMVGRQHGAKPR